MDRYTQETCQEIQEILEVQQSCQGNQETFDYIQRRPPLIQKICEKVFAKTSIFSSKMAQETILYAQEMSQEAQETCHRVQGSLLTVVSLTIGMVGRPKGGCYSLSFDFWAIMNKSKLI